MLLMHLDYQVVTIRANSTWGVFIFKKAISKGGLYSNEKKTVNLSHMDSHILVNMSESHS